MWRTRESGVLTAETRFGSHLIPLCDGGLVCRSDAAFLASALRFGSLSFDAAPIEGPGERPAMAACLFAAARRVVQAPGIYASWSLVVGVDPALFRELALRPGAHALLSGLNPARVELILGAEEYHAANAELAALELLGITARRLPSPDPDEDAPTPITEIDPMRLPTAACPEALVREVVRDLRLSHPEIAAERIREASADWPESGLVAAWRAWVEHEHGDARAVPGLLGQALRWAPDDPEVRLLCETLIQANL